ncbi:MAG: YihY/virulence factor BrkB family protein [Salinivirgaceae bacterium]|nr:MAG: YihY/virulence factor BrkB family protein [Salinivirgaceae bacterium]
MKINVKTLNVKQLANKTIGFVKEDVWRISFKDKPKYFKWLIMPLRVLLIAFRGFKEDKVSLRASALTFYSMLSVVPVVAMGFGIAKGFGFEKMLEKQLAENFADQQEVFNYILTFANSFLENTKGGVIAGIGIAVLFWTVMKVFGNIESSFNAIWQVYKPRVWFRKFSDYLTMMLIAPLLIILSTSANVFITTQISKITSEVALLGYFSPIIFFFVQLIPYVLFWFVLTLIYMVMPNTKVSFKSGFAAGVVAGTIFVFTQYLYIYFQVGVSKYNAIYGSFAALPLFLVWLQTSWLIVLFGAEISFSVQNVEKYEFDPDIQNLSPFSKKVLTLIVINLLSKRFTKGEEALTDKDISQQLEIPIKLVRDIIHLLIEANIVSEINTKNNKEKAYQPAQDINNMSISFVLKSLDHLGVDKILATDSAEKEQIEKLLSGFDDQILKGEGAKLVKDIG